MSRLPLAAAAVAAGLLVSAGPFVGSSSAAACPEWTDPKGDASTRELPNPTGLIGDDNLDIVNTSLVTGSDRLTANITTAKLNASSSDAGDEFRVDFTIGGKKIIMYADRGPTVNGTKAPFGFYAGFYNVTDDKTGDITTPVVFDTKTSTVTIVGKLSELQTALGSDPSGKALSAITTITAAAVDGVVVARYDNSAAPAAVAPTAGTACTSGGGGGTPPPTTAPPTTPPPAATPAPSSGGDVPAAGCEHIADVKGDGTPGTTVQGTKVGLPNDNTLDIRSLTFRSDDKLTAFIKVERFSRTTANGNGPRYEWTFTTNGKVVNLYTQIPDTVAQTAIDAQRTALTPTTVVVVPPNTGGRLGTTYDPRFKVTSAFDTVNNLVVLAVDKASVETVVGGPVTDELTVLTTTARMLTPTGGNFLADTAPEPAGKWTVGDNKCFGPAAGVLTNTGATTVQYRDAASVAAKLTSAAGTPLAGKTVRFTIGSVTKTATTGSTGVASTSLTPTGNAGAYSLVTSFAGDDAAAAVSLTTPFTITVEKTKLALTVVKSGVRRTVTAKLLDDDRKAVAGQIITWFVNGKKVSTSKTGSTGAATFTAAKPGQTVKAVYAGLAGRYAGTSAQLKV